MQFVAGLVPKQADTAAEIANQHKVLTAMAAPQLISISAAYGLMSVFISPWIALAAMGFDTMFEGLGLILMRDIQPERQPTRYLLILLSVILMQASYAVPCLLIWQLDVPFAKATAVAILLMSITQLCSLRSVHLPFGVVGWTSTAMITLIGNSIYWRNADNYTGLGLTTFGIFAGMIYTMGVMRATHALHQEISTRGRAADAANLAKGRFMAQMSHELRTPLNAILGMGEAELAITDSPETKARMHTLVSSARGLAVVLDDILEMTGLDEATLQIRPVPINPAEVISTTCDLFRLMADRSGLTMQVQIDNALHRQVLMDPHRLRQCLSNLLSNALKYTDRGGVRVAAGLSSNGELQIDVIDTGPGITPYDCARLFTPFQRGDQTQQGSGLGLSISRGLARQMGGDLVYVAALAPEQKGAHFRLTLPMRPVDTEIEPQPKTVVGNAKGKRILVVDDIATNRLVACTYLRLLGALPQEASSGEAAIAMISQGAPDLVLLDMNMPGLTGLQTLGQIRALPAGQHLPVLAMTADAAAADKQRYLAAGLDGFIGKPLTPETLNDALAAHLPAQGGSARLSGE